MRMRINIFSLNQPTSAIGSTIPPWKFRSQLSRRVVLGVRDFDLVVVWAESGFSGLVLLFGFN